MRCRRVQKLLSGRESSGARPNAVEGHLRQCAECRRFQARLDVLARELASRLATPEPRAGFAGRVLARIPEAGPRATWRDRLVELLPPAPAALATASLGLGVFLAVDMNGAAGASGATDDQGSLFAEFFDVTPFDSTGPGAFSTPPETER